MIPCDKENYRKGTYDWFHDLEEFCCKLEAKVIPQEDIYLDDKLLYSSEQIKGYIEESKRLSIQSKIDGLNQRALNKLKNEITGREITYTPEMKKQLVKDHTKRFGEKKWKGSTLSFCM